MVFLVCWDSWLPLIKKVMYSLGCLLYVPFLLSLLGSAFVSLRLDLEWLSRLKEGPLMRLGTSQCLVFMVVS